MPPSTLEIPGLKMSMKYKVGVKPTDEGVSVHCPGLPGCWSQGATEAEAIANIRDAITEYRAATARIQKDGAKTNT